MFRRAWVGDRDPEQVPHRRLILYRRMQIAARDADVAVTCGVPNFGQRIRGRSMLRWVTQ